MYVTCYCKNNIDIILMIKNIKPVYVILKGMKVCFILAEFKKLVGNHIVKLCTLIIKQSLTA